MAKKSQKRRAHNERSHSGCMWGLISIFDFRHGRSTHKLLSDRKHGSGRHAAGFGSSRSKLELSDFEEKTQGSNDDEGTNTLKTDIGKISVKKLMEDDMSGEQQAKKQIPAIADEQLQSDSEYGVHFGKNNKHTKRTCKVACDIDSKGSKASASLESREPSRQNSFEQFSHLDLAALMEEFCNQIHHRQQIHLQCKNMVDSCDVLETTNHVKHSQLDELDKQLVWKHSVLQEKLSEAAEAFLNQKFIDRHQSKLFMDALDILNSNKELLMRLLQDSNSVLVKHIQDPQVPQPEKVEHNKSLPEEEIGISKQGEETEHRKQMPKHNIHNIFRRIKSQSRYPLKGTDSQTSNHIVVLKPNQTSSQSYMNATTSSPNSSHQALHSLRNEGASGKFNSQFSLSEIKRKLKHAMGENRKEQRSVFMDGILRRIPSKRHDSGNGTKGVADEITEKELPSYARHHIEEAEKPSVSSETGDKFGHPRHSRSSFDHEVASTSACSSRDLTMKTGGYPNHKVSNIYTEAKKHLAEMLSNGDDGDTTNLHVPRTLGRILSLPEYDFSPAFSPRKDKQHGFITAQMRFSSNGKFRIVNENMWWPKPDSNANHLSPSRQSHEIHPCTTDENPEIELHELDSNANTNKELAPDAEIDRSTCSPEGDSKGDVEVTDPVEDNFVNETSESDSSTAIITSETTNIWEEEEFSKCLGSDSAKNGSTSFGSLASSSLVIQKGEPLESINDTPERPSPISVLEPIFSEDINSPTSITSQSAELSVQPLQIHFEEDNCSSLVVARTNTENYSRTCMERNNSIFKYVTTLLQASDVNLDKLVRKFHFSEKLLDPSLFDEVEVLSSQLCSNRKLIFDSTNEVLGEVCERYVGCSPWVGFVHPDIRPAPMGKGIIDEVWEGINCYLIPHLLLRTLDQIVGKDMEKARIWMDFRFDTECIGIEMAELFLEELVLETILDLCCQVC